ncbi:MAG: CRTAC1 family protein, partial [Akkermansiaceae bacterium]|nr:CRTAC1 family protein [Akkermansiaceae bacterium]
RLLRNAGEGGHWVALRLEGRKCNRDAIGARAVVTLPGGATRSKTVRAGDGFLAQSSRWLHFGLGQAESIEGLVIHWP